MCHAHTSAHPPQPSIAQPKQHALSATWLSPAGALAGFAAATEFTFGSIVQRIMTWPGCVRFHCEQRVGRRNGCVPN